MCALGGIGPSQATLGWVHPLTLSGILFGILALALGGAVLFGWTAVLSPIASVLSSSRGAAALSTDRAAFLALAALMAIKWAIGLAFLR